MAISRKQNGGFLTKTGFMKALLLYMLLLLIAAVLALGLLRMWTDAFEKAQPDGPVKEFIESLSDDTLLYAILNEKLRVSAGSFESRESIIRDVYMKQVQEALRSDKLLYGKDLDAIHGDHEQVFAVYLEKKKIFSVTVEKHTRKAGFFMDSWTVWETVLEQDGFCVTPTDYQVVVPAGAMITVNGRDATGMTESTDGVVLCAFEEQPLRADVCKLKGLYGKPEITVRELDPATGTVRELPLTTQLDHTLYYLDGGENFRSCSFTVPYGVEVYVNGIMLTKANCFSYESAAYPSDASSPYGMPDCCKYQVRYLRSEPEVSATYCGVNVEPVRTGEHYSFQYPTELLYDLRIEVPHGAAVTVGGVPLSSATAITAEMTSLNLPKYASYMSTLPMTEVYTLEGLYLVPQVEVTMNGQTLSREADSTSGRSLLYTYLPAASDTLQEEQENRVKKFMRAYINYVGQGKYNLDSNRYSLLDLCLRSSGAYKAVNSSYAELIWVTSYSGMEYNYLNTSEYVQLSEDCFVCKAEFSVDISRSGVVKHFESSMKLLVIRTKGDWKVAEFSFL